MTGRGVGPNPPPRPTNPSDGPPKPGTPGAGTAMQDPAVLRDLHSIWMRGMERAGLTLADLHVPAA